MRLQPHIGNGPSRGPSVPLRVFSFGINELGGTGLGQSFLEVSQAHRVGTAGTEVGQSFWKWCPGYNPRRYWVSALLGQRDRCFYLKSYYYSIGSSVAHRVAPAAVLQG